MYELIEGELAGSSILVITHRRSLAKKYHARLGDSGFTCYLDADGSVTEERTIVCINSIHRIPERCFQAIFIDEAVGVLSQLTSQLLRDHGIIICRLSNLLLRAERVYFLDAFVTSTIVHDYATLLASHKAVAVRWIRNQFILKKEGSARQTEMVLGESAGCKTALQAAFLDHICKSLQAGRKVYVPCTTKACADTVAAAVAEKALTDRFQVYTSTSDDDAKQHAIADVDAAWAQLDLVVASNAIESGVSCELKGHFTEVRGAEAGL